MEKGTKLLFGFYSALGYIGMDSLTLVISWFFFTYFGRSLFLSIGIDCAIRDQPELLNISYRLQGYADGGKGSVSKVHKVVTEVGTEYVPCTYLN